VIRSMTGFASVTREGASARVHVTVKAVNHRFLDVQIRAPQSLGAVEGRVRQLLGQGLTRGRIELTLTLEHTAPPEREVILDEALLDRVAHAVEAARVRGVVTGGLTVSDVMRIPQLIEIRSKAGDAAAAVSDDVQGIVEVAVGEAVRALVEMRETEGRFLGADLDGRLATLGGYVDDLERLADAGQEDLAGRLRARMAELPPDLAMDQAALAQEIVRFVARSDVDEELVRMRGHLGHWRTLADGPEPCGRKLDFLLQEMNREINTIGSKVDGSRATEVVIAAKAELERIREQVQNVE
jgi:uncharacterized protein (TIGR00255 family)